MSRRIHYFITALYALAEHCGYSALHGEMIRDWIVVGILNSSLSEKLQLDPHLTLARAVTQACQAEAVKQQQLLVRRKPDKSVWVLLGTAEAGIGRQSGAPGTMNLQTTTLAVQETQEVSLVWKEVHSHKLKLSALHLQGTVL